MEFRDNKAIYLQIVDLVCEYILTGKWPENERIMAIRELAVSIEVNPNTVQRTYDFLQQKDIIFNKRGVGYFVAEGAKTKALDYQKNEFMQNDLPLLIKNMNLLGIGINEIEKAFFFGRKGSNQ